MAARPVISDSIARNIINPKAYQDWDIIHRDFTELRQSTPLAWAEIEGYDPFWVVSKHADIMNISRRPAEFINNGHRAGFLSKEGFARQAAMAESVPPLRSLPIFDGDEHRKIRALTQSWFMPRQLKQLEDNIRAIARQSIDGMIEQGSPLEFVSDVALGFPLRVIMAILGVQAEDEPILMKLTQEFFNPQDPEVNQSLDEKASAEVSMPTSIDAIAGFASYFNDLTAERRRNPTNDVASVIANSSLKGELISDWDAVSYYVTIATAGHDTTSSSISGAIWALCEDPDQFLAIRNDRSLIPGLVDEAIRWTTPVRHFMRTAAVDVELGGQSIRKDDWLMLVYPSGNRDEDVFDRPFTFDARRSPNPHLGFGYGAHLCLGLHLAKMEMRIFFEEFFSRISSVSFAGTPQLTRSVFVGGAKTLPVSFTVG